MSWSFLLGTSKAAAVAQCAHSIDKCREIQDIPAFVLHDFLMQHKTRRVLLETM